MTNLTNLSKLILSDNKFKEEVDVLCNLKSLKELNMSSCSNIRIPKRYAVSTCITSGISIHVLFLLKILVSLLDYTSKSFLFMIISISVFSLPTHSFFCLIFHFSAILNTYCSLHYVFIL